MRLPPLLKALSLALMMGSTTDLLAAETTVRMVTSLGEVEIALDGDRAPETVTNFLRYVDEGFYNGTIFHRVIDGFMVQGGGFTPEMQEKETHAPIRNEAKNGLKNARGTLAMARTSDPHSASAQFFINTVDNAALDYPSRDGWGYCVFGRVTKGLETVDRIAKVDTGVKAGMRDVPKEPVVIQSVVRLQAP